MLVGILGSLDIPIDGYHIYFILIIFLTIMRSSLAQGREVFSGSCQLYCNGVSRRQF